jgi:hypothetical protein
MKIDFVRCTDKERQSSPHSTTKWYSMLIELEWILVGPIGILDLPATLGISLGKGITVGARKIACFSEIAIEEHHLKDEGVGLWF